MKILVCVLVLGASAFAEKMNVKVVSHTVDGNGYASSVPAAAIGDADPSASSDSSSAAYVPVSTVRGSLNEVLMTLLLPDGRRVDVGCEDRPRGLTKFSPAQLQESDGR